MQPFLETWQAGLRRGIRRRRTLASLRIWSTRFAFWLGAVIVGLAAAAFAELTEDASRWFVASAAALPWLPFLLAPAMGAVMAVSFRSARNWRRLTWEVDWSAAALALFRLLA